MNCETERKEKTIWISSLRGLACIFVVFSHILATDARWGAYASGCGKIGVWLFMILSGMLFAKSSFFYSEHLTVSTILKFYEKKILRIYPSLLISLGLFWLLFHSGEDIKNLLLFKSAWGHFWYIPVILKFSFAALWQLLNTRTDHAKELFSVIMLVLVILLSFAFPFPSYPENSIALCWYLPVFIIGILAAPIVDLLPAGKWEMDLFSAIGFLLIFSFTPLGRQLLWGYPPSSFLQNKYLLISYCWVLVIIGIVFGQYTKKIFEKTTVLLFISDYSYEIYLFHFLFLLWLWGNWQMPTWLRGGLTVIGSLALGIPTSKIVQWMQRKATPHVLTAIVFIIVLGLILIL